MHKLFSLDNSVSLDFDKLSVTVPFHDRVIRSEQIRTEWAECEILSKAYQIIRQKFRSESRVCQVTERSGKHDEMKKMATIE